MENIEEFRKYAHEIVDWIAEYYENIESYPVKSKVQPGEIFSLLPEEPPGRGSNRIAGWGGHWREDPL